jgi:small subunit ribosomal protein S3
MGSIGVKVWIYHGEKLPGQAVPAPALEGSGRQQQQRNRRNNNRNEGRE